MPRGTTTQVPEDRNAPPLEPGPEAKIRTLLMQEPAPEVPNSYVQTQQPTPSQTDEELLNSLVFAAVNVDASERVRSWFYKVYLAPKDQWERVTAFPIVPAPGLSDVLQSAVPPTIDFFKSLPTLPNDALVWGIYALVFEKEDQLPKLYIGSGTESKIGLRDRFRDYNRGDFTDLPSKCLKKGWTEKHRGLLCWSSIPPEIDIPLQRLRFLAIEATLAFAFSVVRNRPQKTDDVWSEIVPWPQATFPWAPLCTHSAFWEVPRGIDKINITSEELEERKAMQAQRKYCPTCHRNFTTPQGLNQHMESQTHFDNVQREVYKKQFGKWPEDEVENDVVEVDDSFWLYCPTCHKNFKTEATLDRHMGCQTHIDNVRREVYKEQFGKWPEHKDEKDVVEVDDRSSRDYNNSDSLKETRRQRAEAKPTNLFHCPTCNKDFKTQKTLNSHLGNQTHIDKERIKNGDAPSKDQVQRAKNIAAKMFSCKDCNPYYFYGSHEDLLRHFTRKKHLERIRPLKEQGEVSLEEHLALDKLKESQQLKEQTQILVRIPGEGIVGLEEAVGRKDGMLMMLRNKKQFRKFAGVEKDVVEVDDRSSIKPRLLFPPKPKEAEIPNLDEEAPTDDEDNVLLFPPDAEIPDSDAPTDDELAPALPLAIVRTTRAGTKRASETLSVGAGPAKRTRT